MPGSMRIGRRPPPEVGSRKCGAPTPATEFVEIERKTGGLSPSPGQRVEREYRPVNAAKRQGAEVADIGPRREHGVTLRRDRVIGAPVSDAGLHADDRKCRGLDTLA